MTNSFAPSLPRYMLDPFFTRHISYEHFDTKKAFFRNTNQEKINFIWDLSLSQQHILTRFGNRCFLPCFIMDINRHLNGLYGQNHELISLSVSSSLLSSFLVFWPEFTSEDKRLQSAETQRPRRLNKEPAEEKNCSNGRRSVCRIRCFLWFCQYEKKRFISGGPKFLWSHFNFNRLWMSFHYFCTVLVPTASWYMNSCHFRLSNWLNTCSQLSPSAQTASCQTWPSFYYW